MNTQKHLHAPYHFVPLSDWMYSPAWSALVSHDMPFKDGINGTLTVELTNVSELCVGSGTQDQVVKFARNHRGQPIIPGSSLKGMLRSVLEIASFGKFSQVEDKHLSYRDMVGKSTYLDILGKTRAQAAYIKKVDGEYKIYPCRHARFYIKDIEKLTHKNIPITDSSDTASLRKKLDLLGNDLHRDLHLCLESKKVGKKQRLVDCIFTDLSKIKEGAREIKDGRIVCVGTRPTVDHISEYVFYSRSDEPQTYDGIVEIIDLFFKGQVDAAGKISEQLNALYEHYDFAEGVPVFLRLSNKRVVGIGIAQMPKIPYKCSTADLIPKALRNDSLSDFCDNLFGTINENKGDMSMRSRVQLSDATGPSERQLNISDGVVLMSPRSSFYQGYLEQYANSNKKCTYDESSTRLKGWKRYPVRTKSQTNAQAIKNDNVTNKLEYLNPGVTFTFTINVHNLKPEELSGLMWALRLNDSQRTDLAHSLGHGKPLGFGAVQCVITESNLTSNQYQSVDLTQVPPFADVMDDSYPGTKWADSPQIQHLQSFSKYKENDERDELKYMELGSSREVGPCFAKKGNYQFYPWTDKDLAKEALPRTEHLNKSAIKHHIRRIFKDDKDLQIDFEQQQSTFKISDLTQIHQSHPEILFLIENVNNPASAFAGKAPEIEAGLKALIKHDSRKEFVEKILALVLAPEVRFIAVKEKGKALNKNQKKRNEERKPMIDALKLKYTIQ